MGDEACGNPEEREEHEHSEERKEECHRCYVKDEQNQHVDGDQKEQTAAEVGCEPPVAISKAEKRKRFMELCSENCTVVIDCEYSEYETEKEAKSLANQLMQSYAYNKKAEKPVKLVICGIQPDTHLARALYKISGTDQWLCTIESKSIQDLFEPQTLTYLSADADEVLEDIEQDGVYVIGGIVDRNRLKGITLSKAKRIGAACKKLPIREHVQLTNSHVLSVTACVSIFLNYTLNRDWYKALLDSIPKRKF